MTDPVSATGTQSTTKSDLTAAQALRMEAMDGICTFEAQLNRQLNEYRRQRAWQVMLAIRKAYTLAVRDGWRGRARLLRWLLLDIPRGKADLEDYDLQFPDPWLFMPEFLQTSSDKPWTDSLRLHPALSGGPCFDVVILPIFDFEFRFQRPQQLALQFAKAGHRVFWVSPSRKKSPACRKAYEISSIRHNIWEVRLGGPPLALYTGPLTADTVDLLRRELGQLWKDYALAESCAFLQFPFWRRLGLALREDWGARVVYDCMDDWSNWPTEPLISRENLEDEQALMREADVVVATAKELVDRCAAQGLDAVLAPNATDFDFFHAAASSGQLEGLPRPVIGYYGAIADWFDAEAVAAIARSRPNYSLVLIGQVHGRDLSALKALPNVHFLGERRYREIPGCLRSFDVALIPFVVNNLTSAVDPVKMYEYLSQGKPVVASYMPELLQYREHLYLANTPEDFVRQVDLALAEDRSELQEERIAFAAANTWSHRFAVIERRIDAAFPRVSLIVLTYNNREFIGPFHDSIRRNVSWPNLEIVYVDNNSSDGTAEVIASISASDSRVTTCLNAVNLGFSGGNNLGVRQSTGDYLIILNPDTILTRGCVERLLRPLRKDPATGMTAPVTNFSGNQTRIRTSYANLAQMEAFAHRLSVDKAGEVMDVPVIPLLCGALSRKTWDQVGGLDERFRIGTFEDDDFSMRIHAAGYRTVTAEDCFIHHFGNGSFGKLSTEESLRVFRENRQAFESKWKREWRPHTTRPGVAPPGPADRFAVSAFVAGFHGAEP